MPGTAAKRRRPRGRPRARRRSTGPGRRRPSGGRSPRPGPRPARHWIGLASCSSSTSTKRIGATSRRAAAPAVVQQAARPAPAGRRSRPPRCRACAPRRPGPHRRMSSIRSPRRGLDSSTTSSSGRPSSAARPNRPARAEGAGSDGRSASPASASSRTIRTRSDWSSPSRMVKAGGRPARAAWRRRSAAATAWNVPAVSARRSTPQAAAARAVICRAARRVKVSRTTDSGGVPVSTRWARVATMVRVLPVPAEAITRQRPPAPSTAASCSGSRPARRRALTPSPAAAGRSRYTRRAAGSAASGSRGA